MLRLLQKERRRGTIVSKHTLNKTDEKLKYKRWINYTQD